MDIETVRAAMEEQLELVRESRLQEVFNWEIEVCDTTVYVRMRPRQAVSSIYLLRASFDDFPRRAPSCVFVDRASKQHNDGAWPSGVRHGSAPPGICTPGTRECHEHYHRNDAKHEWDSARIPFLSTLAEINRLIERGHK